MPQVVACTDCGKLLQLPDALAGKSVRCPNCFRSFVAPDPGASTTTSAAAATPTAQAPVPSPPASVPGARNSGRPAVPSPCPICSAAGFQSASGCAECGYRGAVPVAASRSTTDSAVDDGLNLCPNSACGTLNQPGDRLCRRCGTTLPGAIGQLIGGRFRIDQPLATGGFGVVYRATDTHSGTTVAVKEMLAAEPKEFEIRRTFFRREAQILQSLQALPIVPRFHALIEDASAAYLVIEFIPGRDLLTILQSPGGKPFSVDQAVAWGRRIADVLIRMHDAVPPLVHRDLKPDNIMLMPDGRTPRMIDFGSARELGTTATDRGSTKTKVYTEGYAPPEQVVGKPEPRSDLFALAGTLYHLITGCAPEGYFTGREIQENLPQYPAGDRWFYELLAINLSEDPCDRYPSAAELARDLAAGQVTREIRCDGCGSTVPSREPYCRECARPLVSAVGPCHKCGHGNRVGTRYCVRCGRRT